MQTLGIITDNGALENVTVVAFPTDRDISKSGGDGEKLDKLTTDGAKVRWARQGATETRYFPVS